MKLSLIIPAKDEGVNLRWMKSLLEQVLGDDCELILVDDGSTDDTMKVMENLRKFSTIRHIKLISFPVSIGKTKALLKGFSEAEGELLAHADADNQVNVLELPLLVAKLEEGYDLVCGWRTNRFAGDSLMKKLQSDVFNWIIRKVTSSKLHDHNCPLKVFKRECLKAMDLSEEGYQTFIVPMVQKAGYKTVEVPVSWSRRMYGQSKFFGLKRLTRGWTQMIQLKKEGKI